MSKSEWNGADHYNSSEFIEMSIKMPRQEFSHNKLPLTLTYRQIGDRNNEEAVVFIPSVYETEASSYRIAPLFVNAGYRFISVTTGNHKRFEDLIMTFDQFFKFLKVKKVHLVGCDLGGFICLQIQNTINFAAKVLSLTLINSYTRNDMYVPREITLFSIFGSLVSKLDLNKELDEFDQKGGPTNSSLFIRKELESLTMNELGARITLRMAMTPPLYLHVPPQAIMSIEPLDRRMTLTPRFLPSLTIGGVKQAMMKYGGDFPHLEVPEDTFTYILCHIKKWSTPETPAEQPETKNTSSEETQERHQDEEPKQNEKTAIQEKEDKEINNDETEEKPKTSESKEEEEAN